MCTRLFSGAEEQIVFLLFKLISLFLMDRPLHWMASIKTTKHTIVVICENNIVVGSSRHIITQGASAFLQNKHQHSKDDGKTEMFFLEFSLCLNKMHLLQFVYWHNVLTLFAVNQLNIGVNVACKKHWKLQFWTGNISRSQCSLFCVLGPRIVQQPKLMMSAQRLVFFVFSLETSNQPTKQEPRSWPFAAGGSPPLSFQIHNIQTSSCVSTMHDSSRRFLSKKKNKKHMLQTLASVLKLICESMWLTFSTVLSKGDNIFSSMNEHARSSWQEIKLIL